jgi:hypothetical protein
MAAAAAQISSARFGLLQDHAPASALPLFCFFFSFFFFFCGLLLLCLRLLDRKGGRMGEGKAANLMQNLWL